MTVQLNNIVNTTTGVREYNVNMAATILAAVGAACHLLHFRPLVRPRHRRRRGQGLNDGSVSVRNLDVSFGALKVIENLNLEVDKGEFIVLLGPSGCGKSTLLNAIAGLLDIDRGQIWIDGKNVTWAEPKDRGIGMVFQSYALYPRMTVEGNLSFGLKMAGVPRDEIAARVNFAGEAPAHLRSPQAPAGRSSPAASASASPSAGRWSARSTSSCSTSRSPTSTPSFAPSCASN